MGGSAPRSSAASSSWRASASSRATTSSAGSLGGDRDAVGHEDHAFGRIGRVDGDHALGPEIGEARLGLDDDEGNHGPGSSRPCKRGSQVSCASRELRKGDRRPRRRASGVAPGRRRCVRAERRDVSPPPRWPPSPRARRPARSAPGPRRRRSACSAPCASIGRADPSGHRHFGERDRKPAVGKVLDRRRSPGCDEGKDEFAVAPLGDKIDRRRRALLAAGDDASQAERPSQPGAPPTSRISSPGPLKAGVAVFVTSATRPTPPMAGVGGMPAPIVSL